MTKTAMTIATVLLTTSFGASANFQPWESARPQLDEVQSQPADIEVGPFYRDESQVIQDVPDAVQRAARYIGPYYLKS